MTWVGPKRVFIEAVHEPVPMTRAVRSPCHIFSDLAEITKEHRHTFAAVTVYSLEEIAEENSAKHKVDDADNIN